MEETSREIDDKVKSAETLITSKSFQDAINLLLDVIDFYDEAGEPEKVDVILIKIDSCYQLLAQQLKSQHDYFEAAETYCSAAFLQNQHDKIEPATLLFNEAIDCYLSAGQKALQENDYLEASRLYNSAANYAKSELQDNERARNYYQKSIDVLRETITQSLNENDYSDLCRIQLELGKVYENLEDYNSAINQYQKVIEYSTQNGLNFIGECFQHMAACYECLGNIPQMNVCLNKSVNYRLQDAENCSKCNLPLEAVQNFMAAADCVTRLKKSDDLLKQILRNEADCFLTVAKSHIAQGNLLQAAYYERNAAYCYNQLGQAEASIDLFLAAAEKLLSLREYYGAANNFHDASVYQEILGNQLKAADYALQAAKFAKKSGDFELTVQNFLRAAQIFQKIGYIEKSLLCYSSLAECYVDLAESNLTSHKFHLAAFLYFKAGIFYSQLDGFGNAATCFERAIKNYEKAINVALKDNENLLASYSACCATLVCLIMKQPARAEIILYEMDGNSSNNYYLLSSSIIKAFKAQDATEYDNTILKFSKIIEKSPEIENMLNITKNYL